VGQAEQLHDAVKCAMGERVGTNFLSEREVERKRQTLLAGGAQAQEGGIRSDGRPPLSITVVVMI
jgi:hypothetical protein